MKMFFKPIGLIMVIMALLMVSGPVLAQDSDINYRFGIETDYLAYRIGGSDSYLIGAWLGKDHVKYSLIYADIDYLKEHETYEEADSTSQVIALRVDYFPNEELKGFWYGGFLLYEKDKIVYKNQTGKLNTFAIGLSSGYNFYITERFYIAPYVNVMKPVNDDKCVINGKTFEPASWSFEPGIKIGFEF